MPKMKTKSSAKKPAELALRQMRAYQGGLLLALAVAAAAWWLWRRRRARSQP